MSKHILQYKSFNIPFAIWLATSAHILNGYDKVSRPQTIWSIQDFRSGLRCPCWTCLGQVVFALCLGSAQEIYSTYHHPHQCIVLCSICRPLLWLYLLPPTPRWPHQAQLGICRTPLIIVRYLLFEVLIIHVIGVSAPFMGSAETIKHT